jgi:hypothetical protein
MESGSQPIRLRAGRPGSRIIFGDAYSPTFLMTCVGIGLASRRAGGSLGVVFFGFFTSRLPLSLFPMVDRLP